LGTFLRQKYKEKPQAWGPVAAVQRSLFMNAESIGIDPGIIGFADIGWSAVRSDYIKKLVGVNTGGVTFKDNSPSYNGTGYTLFGRPLLFSGRTKVTVLAIARPKTITDHDMVVSETTISALNNGWGLEFYGGNARFFINSWNLNVAYVGISPGVESVLIGRYDGGEAANQINIWNSGVKGTPDTYTAAINSNADINLNKLAVASGFSGNNVDGEIPLIVLFTDALPDSQIALLSDNPYQLLQPVPMRSYSFASDEPTGQTISQNLAWKLLADRAQEISWNTLTEESKESAWKIFNSKEQESSWNIKKEKSQDTAWKILTLGGMSQETAWRILADNEQDLAWNIKADKAQELSWRISTQNNLNSSWNLKIAINQNTAWRILATGGMSQEISWRILTGQEQSTAWNIKTSKAQESAWRIINSSDSQTAWRIATDLESSMAWRILNSASRDSAWKISTRDNQNLSWNLKADIGLDLSWKIITVTDQDVSWSILTDVIPVPLYEFTKQARTFIFNKQARTFIFFK